MVRMTKIIGSSKDLGKKEDSSLTKNAQKVEKETDKAHESEAEETLKSKKGTGSPYESPLSEAGLELIPPDADKSQAIDEEGVTDDLRLYRAVCETIHQVMTDVATLDVNTVSQLGRYLINRLETSNALVRLAMRDRYIEPFLGAHPVNVAILSARLADALKFDDTRKLRLVVAALIHDIGMTRLTPDILQNQRDLTQDEENMLWQHPNFGGEIVLEQLGSNYEWLALIVRQEHERVQGQGYPNGLKEDQIDINALIIGLLDVFEAITHPRRQNTVFNPSKAINQIITTRNQLFSTRIVKALVEAVSVYPVETYVQLNTGQIGRVISTYPQSPLRPLIEVFTDHAHQRLPRSTRIDLRENPVLSILKALDDSEVPDFVVKGKR